jgi:hypothetical protein
MTGRAPQSHPIALPIPRPGPLPIWMIGDGPVPVGAACRTESVSQTARNIRPAMAMSVHVRSRSRNGPLLAELAASLVYGTPVFYKRQYLAIVTILQEQIGW